MKTPLNYQITESDCGTITFLNALSYSMQREEIPACVAHLVMSKTLDICGHDGSQNSGGTSVPALIDLRNEISKNIKLPVEIDIHNDGEFDLGIYKNSNFFENSGCLMACVWLMHDRHYVLITKISKKYAYIFDPYYVKLKYFQNNRTTKIIRNKHFSCNRRIKLSRLNSVNHEDYSLVKNDKFQFIMSFSKK